MERQVAWLAHGTAKTGEGRGIPMSSDAIAVHVQISGTHSDYCFACHGKPMDRIGSAYKRSLKKVQIEDFRFHDLRHTWASWH